MEPLPMTAVIAQMIVYMLFRVVRHPKMADELQYNRRRARKRLKTLLHVACSAELDERQILGLNRIDDRVVAMPQRTIPQYCVLGRWSAPRSGSNCLRH